ncbi:MAG: response regulator transcription factor [Nitratireductor sp.]|nr:response regulator transcription factor [Nitratireductor sp.]
MHTVTVVVADDHPLYRSGVVVSLREQEDILVVGEASNGDEVVQLASEKKPDVVLLDISMPGGGVDALSRINQVSPKTRTVMLTVSESDDDIFSALDAGAAGYVLKGVGSDELTSVVKSVAAGQSYVSPSLAARVLRGLKDGGKKTPKQLLSTLTDREVEILKLVAEGMSNKEVGRALDLQEKTVKHYMTNILQKINAKNRVEAAIKAREAWNG